MSRKSFVTAFTVIVLLAIAGYAAGVGGEGDPEMIGESWVYSAAAEARDSVVDCGTDAKCMEWCFLYQGGTAVGTGRICCVEDGTERVLGCG
ncbi:MAG: hypothetical protein MPN21_18985 [Thermoanaerobaculia bacterium]|nr:hypothetical protein [Thermoanaerobaculia bacterium]